MAGQDDSAELNATVASPSDDIDISTPAVVAWGSGAILTDVTFNACRRASNSTAFFKLRTALALKSVPSTRIALFLFVHPERIRSLELLDRPNVEHETTPEPGAAAAPDVVRTKLGTNIMGLKFTLDRPADLIGPKETVLIPKNNASGHVLDSMRVLSRQDSFILYFPQNVLSKARLASLCNAVCAGAARTIARHADIASLYRGKGGQVMAGPGILSDAAADVGTPSINPPPYDEINPGPPPAPLAILDDFSASKKRRRSSSSDLTRDVLDLRQVEATCRKLMDEHRAEMLRRMEAQQEVLFDRLLVDLKPYIANEICQLETRIFSQLEQQSAKQALQQQEQQQQHEEEVDQQLEELGREMDHKVDAIEDRVEDEFYGLRLRLEDFVKEEVEEAEARVIEHLQNTATISLQFER